MRKKAIIRYLGNAYRSGKMKRRRPYIPEHPLLLLLKASKYFIEGTILLMKSSLHINKEQGPEALERHMNYLEESGILQMHAKTADSLKQASEKLTETLTFKR